jgi:inosine-uridine nucleoside N-ribohydrolase
MVDLTACAQALLTRNEASRLRESADPAGKFVAAISESYIRFAESSGSAGAAIHDALAVGIAIDPLVAKTVRPVHVDVETKGEFTYGATVTNLRLTVEHSERRGDRFAIVDFPAVKPNAAYPAVVNGQRFVQMFVKRMTQAPAGGK